MKFNFWNAVSYACLGLIMLAIFCTGCFAIYKAFV
jgi:hypothetical protein